MLAPKRQTSAAKMVGAVLEQVQGMSVIKSFNLKPPSIPTSTMGAVVSTSSRTVVVMPVISPRLDALVENCKCNLDVELLFTPYTIAQGLALQLDRSAALIHLGDAVDPLRVVGGAVRHAEDGHTVTCGSTPWNP